MATSVISATAAVQRALHKACFASGSRPPPRTLQPRAKNGDAEPHGAQQAAMRRPAEVPLAATPPLLVARRAALGLGASALLLSLWPTSSSALAATDATELLPASIQLALAPDQMLYDASDPQLRAAAQLLQQALNASDVVEEEALWSKIIADYGGLKQNWVPDLVGRVSGCTLWQHELLVYTVPALHSEWGWCVPPAACCLLLINSIMSLACSEQSSAVPGGHTHPMLCAGVGQPRQRAQQAGQAGRGAGRLQPQH